MASTGHNLVADDYVSMISSNRMNLLEFVEKQKSAITNQDVNVRSSAFELLESVIIKLPPACFSELEAEQVAKYCVSVFALQTGKTKSLLAALHYLVTHLSIKLEILKDMILSLLKRRIVISSLQLERSRIYAIILEYLNRSQMGSDESEIANELLKSADGEADPRCLILLFKIGEVLAQKFELGPVRDDLFQFMEFYSPITYKPSSYNPCGITRENLETSLNLCLTASDWLAEHVFGSMCTYVNPSLSFKEKDDCLNLLNTALHRFSRQTVRLHGERILKFLVPPILWPTKGEAGESEWLTVYNRLVEVMFFDDAGSLSEDWSKFLEILTADLQKFYHCPELGSVHMAHQMLILAAACTADSFWFLLRWAADRIFENFQMAESNRQNYAEQLLDWCQKLKDQRTADIGDMDIIRRIKVFAKENLLASDQFVLNDVGVAVSVNLAFSFSNLFDNEDAVTISLKLMDLLSVGSPQYSRQCLNWFGLVAKKSWPLLENTIYPLLCEKYDVRLVELNVVPPMMAASKEPARSVLLLLTRRIMLASSEPECMAILPFVKNILNAIDFSCANDFQEFSRIVFAFAILTFGKALLDENGPSEAQVSTADAYGKLMQDMFLAAPTSLSRWFLNEVIGLAAGRKDTFFQSSLCMNVFSPVIFAATAADLIGHEEFLLSLWKSEPCHNHPTECKQRCRCHILFSCLAHNIDSGPLLDEILLHWANRCEELFRECSKCYVKLGYLARALLLRNHPVGITLLERFFTHLRVANRNEAVEALQIVYTSPSDAVNNECYRRLAPFCVERIAGYSVQLLHPLFQELKSSEQEELMERTCETFALLWDYAPNSVAVSDFQFVAPMLAALKSAKESVRNVAVEFFNRLLTTENSLLNGESQAQLIEICEGLVSCCSENSHAIVCSRVFACLQRLSLAYGSEFQRSFRCKIVKAIAPFLSHKKRLVRQAAAEAVNAW
ncbi:MMS19 C and MMS19 N domain containing protein [Trichuris trichiura]|uniref:MMS19 nucleotide excision repair protein n=1 Tax=Trichuris trichiura TaxID=36087 RepID=A0A077ZHB1_TRITR|nr:MMS19 C and MMS19 N domain containing protein [Trichuris trichiura]